MPRGKIMSAAAKIANISRIFAPAKTQIGASCLCRERRGRKLNNRAGGIDGVGRIGRAGWARSHHATHCEGRLTAGSCVRWQHRRARQHRESAQKPASIGD